MAQFPERVCRAEWEKIRTSGSTDQPETTVAKLREHASTCERCANLFSQYHSLLQLYRASGEAALLRQIKVFPESTDINRATLFRWLHPNPKGKWSLPPRAQRIIEKLKQTPNQTIRVAFHCFHGYKLLFKCSQQGDSEFKHWELDDENVSKERSPKSKQLTAVRVECLCTAGGQISLKMLLDGKCEFAVFSESVWNTVEPKDHHAVVADFGAVCSTPQRAFVLDSNADEARFVFGDPAKLSRRICLHSASTGNFDSLQRDERFKGEGIAHREFENQKELAIFLIEHSKHLSKYFVFGTQTWLDGCIKEYSALSENLNPRDNGKGPTVHWSAPKMFQDMRFHLYGNVKIAPPSAARLFLFRFQRMLLETAPKKLNNKEHVGVFLEDSSSWNAWLTIWTRDIGQVRAL